MAPCPRYSLRNASMGSIDWCLAAAARCNDHTRSPCIFSSWLQSRRNSAKCPKDGSWRFSQIFFLRSAFVSARVQALLIAKAAMNFNANSKQSISSNRLCASFVSSRKRPSTCNRGSGIPVNSADSPRDIIGFCFIRQPVSKSSTPFLASSVQVACKMRK